MRVESPSLRPAPRRSLCTDCGISRTTNPSLCATACQFIAPDYPRLEKSVHGRTRDPDRNDEAFFGVTQRMLRAALTPPAPDAQWTGITTSLAARLLEKGQVDAVLTVAPDADDRWKPVPVLVTSSHDLQSCRGMRMGFAPTLALLEQAEAKGYKRIAVIGIPCQVYALRSMEASLGFDRLYVIGTPCSDNTTTERFHQFLALLDDHPERINYLEFRADYRVEIRYEDGGKRTVPFLQLPISKLPPDFFPLTCRTCVDYTNSLADLTVGYMAASGEQWLIIRNARGGEILSYLESELKVSKLISKGSRQGPVEGFRKNTERAGAGLPLRSMPNFLRPVMGWLMPIIGPKGLEFARARVEMKAVETIVHLRRRYPGRIKHMVPDHVWRLAERYGYQPEENER